MEQNLHSSYSESSSSSSSEEEEYINMEVDHSSFDSSIFSQSTIKEFEFQSFSSSSDRDNNNTTSPADELFYMGKLLPLHLPPRLEMVHRILQNSSSFDSKKDQQFEDEAFGTPLFTPTANTPFESCNASPSESRHVSGELIRNEHFVEYLAGFQEKKSWSRKLKWANLKSLLTKSSGCSGGYSAAAADQRQLPKEKRCMNGHCMIATNKNSEDHKEGGHRRSFSGAFKRLSKAKSSFPSSSTGCCSANSNRSIMRRSAGPSSEIESPIQAAIAHCKRSQK